MPWQMTRVSLSQLHSTDSDTPTSTAIETQQHETAIEPQQHDTARLVRSAPSHSNCYRHSYAAEPRSPRYTDARQFLPDTAASYFSLYAKAKPSLSSTLQSELSKQASIQHFMASLIAAEQKRRHDGGAAIAHARAISATYASAWKRAAPTQPMATLTDNAYRISARLNLRLTPFPASA